MSSLFAKLTAVFIASFLSAIEIDFLLAASQWLPASEEDPDRCRDQLHQDGCGAVEVARLSARDGHALSSEVQVVQRAGSRKACIFQ